MRSVRRDAGLRRKTGGSAHGRTNSARPRTWLRSVNPSRKEKRAGSHICAKSARLAPAAARVRLSSRGRRSQA